MRFPEWFAQFAILLKNPGKNKIALKVSVLMKSRTLD
jgi:hypothetical protein